MSNDPRQTSMPVDRREFLRVGAAGVLLSVLPLPLACAPTDEVTLTAGDLRLALGVADGNVPQLRSLRNGATGFEWCRAGSDIEPVFATGAVHRGWLARRGRARETSAGKRYEFPAAHAVSGVEARYALQGFTDAPVVEFQVEFRNGTERPLSGVSAFGPFRLALRNDLGPLRLHCFDRYQLKLETRPVATDGPRPGTAADVAGGAWNSPTYGGLVVLEAVDTGEFLLVGIEWERDWHYRITREKDELSLTVVVADLAHAMAPGERLSAPRVFLAVAQGDRERAFIVAQRYLKQHVFPRPRPNWPWVVYSFAATDPDGVEAALLREIDFAADLGVDVFCQGATWYEGSSKKGDGDVFLGLGRYTEDRVKYPGGLAAISRRAHERGMKFGLWVAPNCIDRAVVGTAIPERWLAQADGKVTILPLANNTRAAVQACLGCREYVDHLKTTLTGLVERYQLDWLRWDSFGPIAVCNRADHGHQAGDGSHAALVGQYEIFAHLHAKFPDLVLEQCGYGDRFDYGLARMIRSNWMGDSSTDKNVRGNALGTSYMYPSSYNGGWVVQPVAGDAATLDTAYRSRMIGLFGFGMEGATLSALVSRYPEPMLDAARRNLAVYKGYRHLLGQDCYHLLPAQQASDEWNVVQFVDPAGAEAVVLAFRVGSSKPAIRVPLRGLAAGQTYELTFANTGSRMSVSGAALLREGLAISLARPDMSEVVTIRAG